MTFLPSRTSSVGRVDVGVERLYRRCGSRVSCSYRVRHLRRGQPIDRIELTSGQLARGEYTPAKCRKRIVQLACLRQFLFRAVSLRVTAVMPMDAGTTCFDEARAAAGSRAGYCAGRGMEYGDALSAVHFCSGHSEACRAPSQIFSSDGVLDRGPLPVTIVFDDKYGR